MSLRELGNLSFFVIVSFLLSLSITSLFYSILNYLGFIMFIPSTQVRILLAFILAVFTIVLYVKIIKITQIKLKNIDLVSALVLTLPLTLLGIFSPLPLGDDLRYIGSAILVPNGFYSLVGYTVVVFSKVFSLNILSTYWLLIFLMIYAISLVLINILRSYLKIDNSVILFVSAFMIMYIPSIISAFLYPLFLSKPYEINHYIFDIYQFHYLGRNITLDPNLMKNISVLYPLLTLLFNLSWGSAFIVAILWLLAILYHPLDAFTAILLASIYRLLFSNKPKEDIKQLGLIYLITGIIYATISSVFGELLFLFYFKNNIIMHLVNVSLIFVIFIISLILFFIVNRLMRYRVVTTLIFLLLLFSSIFVNLPIEPELQRYISLRAIFLWGFYLVVISYYLYFRQTNLVPEHRVIGALLLPALIIFFLVLFVNILPLLLFELGYSFIDIARYIQVASRTITTPAFGFNLTLFSIPLIINYILKKHRFFLFILISISILNLSYYIMYWGFYYRDPWATGLYNATAMNSLLKSLSYIDINQTPYIHTFNTPLATYTRDLLALKVGLPMFTPVSINDEHIPWTIRNIPYVMPDIIITESTFNILSDLLEPTYIINLGEKSVYLYTFSGLSRTHMLAIVGPLPSPLLSPDYYRALLSLQLYYAPYRLVVVPSDKEATKIGISVIGKISFTDLLPLTDNIVDLKSLWQKGYKYVYVEPNEKTVVLSLRVWGRGSYTYLYPVVYPDYISVKGSFLISINQLVKYFGFVNITINNAAFVFATKDYEIDLSLIKYVPGTVIVYSDSAFGFGGNGFISVSDLPLASNRTSFTIFTKFSLYETDRKEYIIYTESSKWGTLFHLSFVKPGSVVFAIKAPEWQGCSVAYVPNSTVSAMVVKNGTVIGLYVDGTFSCKFNTSNVVRRNDVAFVRIGGSVPTQNVWFNGTISYVAVYSSSFETYWASLARFGLLPGNQLLLFLTPVFNISAIKNNFIICNVSHIKEVPKLIVLHGALNDDAVHFILPHNYSLHICTNTSNVNIIELQNYKSYAEYVVKINDRLFSISLDRYNRKIYLGC